MATFDAKKIAKARKGYARIPGDVGSDPRLKDRDVRVFYALALFERKGSVSIGNRLLADVSRVPRSKISASMRRLVATGHVQVSEADRGRRGSYLLPNTIFETVPKAWGGKRSSVSATVRAAGAQARISAGSRGETLDSIMGSKSA